MIMHPLRQLFTGFRRMGVLAACCLVLVITLQMNRGPKFGLGDDADKEWQRGLHLEAQRVALMHLAQTKCMLATEVAEGRLQKCLGSLKLWPMSGEPTALPSFVMLDSTMTSGKPASWNWLATLISSSPNMRPKRTSAAVSSCCLGKHSTPCSPSARKICLKSPSETGWFRSTASIRVPSAFPLTSIFMLSSLFHSRQI